MKATNSMEVRGKPTRRGSLLPPCWYSGVKEQKAEED